MKTSRFFSVRDKILWIADWFIVILISLLFLFLSGVIESSLTTNQLILIGVIIFLTVIFGSFLGTFRRVGKLMKSMKKLNKFFSIDAPNRIFK